jgi:hypothetical protein
MFENAEVIHRYTRADTIRDGGPVALEASPVRRIRAARQGRARCAAVPPGVAFQDEAGRLWDVLTMLRFAIRGQSNDSAAVGFAVHVRNDNRGCRAAGAPQGAVRAGR